MTMDIKDIIKWFIPCFHILLKQNFNRKRIAICLFLCFNVVNSSKINSELVLSEDLDNAKNENISLLYLDGSKLNQSDGHSEGIKDESPKFLKDTSLGRTFGRPFKKMIAGLLPVIFQVGAASTWAVVAALVGVKTLLVSLLILKVLLIAGAAKLGALFGSKGHHHQHHGWEPPHQKEIHLHIHNNGHEHHEEHPIGWSREGSTADPRPVYVYEPYRAGPQTISTPYGSYMKIDSGSGPLLGPVTVSS